MERKLRLVLAFVIVIISLIAFYVAFSMKKIRLEYMKTLDENLKKKMRTYTYISIILLFILIIITVIVMKSF